MQKKAMRNIRLTSDEKKKNAAHRLAGHRLQSSQGPSTPPLPPVAMELERPSSKRRARMTEKGVENTPAKQMRPAELEG